jgi:Ser/Thr protein kinase RdoA (MazF antagonist)
MPAGPPAPVLSELGLRTSRVTCLKDLPGGNASWLVEPRDGTSVVLRRYHAGAGPADVCYEHAVLGHLARVGWVVPEPVGDLIGCAGLWYCLTRHVPGEASTDEAAAQRRRRGGDLARLHLALRGLGERIGQRPGWQALHHGGVSVRADSDWEAGADALTELSPRLGEWAQAAAAQTHRDLAAIGADELMVMVVHGDFAEQNVHYHNGRLAGVIDFGLTHLDSRPYELAMARTHRAPEALDGYRDELARGGWPLSGLEEAAIEPLYRSLRVDMVAWHLDDGRRTGSYDLAAIERQLSRTGTAAP